MAEIIHANNEIFTPRVSTRDIVGATRAAVVFRRRQRPDNPLPVDDIGHIVTAESVVPEATGHDMPDAAGQAEMIVPDTRKKGFWARIGGIGVLDSNSPPPAESPEPPIDIGSRL